MKEAPICQECKHRDGWECGNPATLSEPDRITGYRYGPRLVLARSIFGKCGRKGKLYEAKAVD